MKRWNAALGVWLLAGCVGTDLHAPEHHPGHPHARQGTILSTKALGPEHDLHLDEPEAEAHQAAAVQASDQGPSEAVYTCPMHPEIVRNEPGNCPICGMKLVPRKAEN